MAHPLLSAAVGGLLAGSVFALVGLGVVLSAAAIRTVNLAVGEFYVLGGLVFYSLAAGAPPLLAAPAAVAAGAGCGLLVERCAIRPLRQAPLGTVVLVTTAAAWMLRGAALLIWGRDPIAPPFPAPSVGPAGQTAAVIAWALLCTAVLEVWLRRSHPGRALRATADDPRAAAGAGVDPVAAARTAFGMAGALLAASALLAGPVTYLSYDGGVGLLLRGIGAGMIGGMRRPAGVYLGGVAIGLVESLTAALWSSLYKDAITFSLLILVLCFWRGGDET
ncbi:MAG: branched-chain amino acid ABC transporter permease [Acetobacteraceae bacterium]|nr:branched-chain amino acid ABC transporter permease [Acetobacteraceae bacterium]